MKIDSCYLYRTIFGMMFFLILSAFITGLYVFVTESYGTFWAYSSFEVSDWLINYEGGFVRRGLIGQLLFFLYQIHPYPVRFAILFICVLGFVTICWLLIRILKKEGMSIFILPFPFVYITVSHVIFYGHVGITGLSLLPWGSIIHILSYSGPLY